MGNNNESKMNSFNSKLTSYFSKLDKKLKDQPGLQVLVYSDKLGIDYQYPTGKEIKPYHLASIGKVFTASTLDRLIAHTRISKFVSK